VAMIDLGQEIPYLSITIFQVLTAIIILFVGLIVAKLITAVFKNQLGKTKLPELVVEFLARFLSSLLYVMVILIVVSVMGVKMFLCMRILRSIRNIIMHGSMCGGMGEKNLKFCGRSQSKQPHPNCDSR